MVNAPSIIGTANYGFPVISRRSQQCRRQGRDARRPASATIRDTVAARSRLPLNIQIQDRRVATLNCLSALMLCQSWLPAKLDTILHGPLASPPSALPD